MIPQQYADGISKENADLGKHVNTYMAYMKKLKIDQKTSKMNTKEQD